MASITQAAPTEIGSNSRKNFHDGSTRGVRVDLYGKPVGKAFRLVTNLTHSDGETQRKVWRFEKSLKGTTLGARRTDWERADLIGSAAVTVAGNEIDINYVTRLLMKGSKLSFKETLLFTKPGRGTH